MTLHGLIRRLTADRVRRLDRAPDFVIWDTAASKEEGQVPYLLRWYLIPRNRFLNVYLHCFLRSDKDVPHDHPWASLSVMLEGVAVERRPGKEDRDIVAGDWVYRRASFAHQIVVPDQSGVWTLFMTGPKVRDWGFLCPKRWVPWQEFVSDHDKGLPGAGCGED